MFHGYIQWDAKSRTWKEDEWLTQIYRDLREAKEALFKFAEGHPFDNDRELQVTRYFGKAADLFGKGEELSKDDPKVVMHEWMRYAVYTLL